jgi:6-pyruvoyltetrahydropterin/6-carboxytetrahydropterin synthase
MQLVSITARYTFEAAHHLPMVPDGHKCRRMHGHNYAVEVTASGPVRTDGFVADFADLDAVVNPLVEMVDHRVLNIVDGLANPTAENIAIWFRDRVASKLPLSISVRVFETDRYWCDAGPAIMEAAQ